MNVLKRDNPYLAILLTIAMLAGCAEDVADNKIRELNVQYDKVEEGYKLNWSASVPTEPVAIKVSESADMSNPQIVTASVTGDEYLWKRAPGVNRYYFQVEPQHGVSTMSSSRWLPLQGGKNFRDLGGYVTADGQQVRWGKLFRTGALNELTPADYQELQEVQIATVIDFRTKPERDGQPTQWQGQGTELLSWEYDLGMDSFAQVFMDPAVTPDKVEAAMAAKYPEMLSHLTEQYTVMFDRLAASDRGMIFHCTAGKDRTGIAAALILTALGVDRPTIEHDFMLSDLYYMTMTDPRRALGGAESQDKSAAAGATQDPKMAMMASLPKELLLPVMGVRPSYINAALDHMEQKSGSVMNYIQQELKVDEQELKRIREHFLQPAVTL